MSVYELDDLIMTNMEEVDNDVYETGISQLILMTPSSVPGVFILLINNAT